MSLPLAFSSVPRRVARREGVHLTRGGSASGFDSQRPQKPFGMRSPCVIGSPFSLSLSLSLSQSLSLSLSLSPPYHSLSLFLSVSVLLLSIAVLVINILPPSPFATAENDFDDQAEVCFPRRSSRFESVGHVRLNGLQE